MRSSASTCITCTKCSYCQQFQRRRAALPRSPVHPLLRAQNDLRRLPSLVPGLALGAGAFKLEPVRLLIEARPLAVKPAPSFNR